MASSLPNPFGEQPDTLGKQGRIDASEPCVQQTMLDSSGFNRTRGCSPQDDRGDSDAEELSGLTTSPLVIGPDGVMRMDDGFHRPGANATRRDGGDHEDCHPDSQSFAWLDSLGYRIIRRIGRGGYGEVFLANHPKLTRQVALKVPRADVVMTERFRRRFLEEAQIVAQLQHPNIVVLHDMIAAPAPGIVYEYCAGGTLHDLLRAGGRRRLDEPTAVRLFSLIADALAFAHGRGVLHRDLKPSNILLQPSPTAGDAHAFEFDGQWLIPKLADFGLAKLFQDEGTETMTGMAMGTPDYMSPEQAVGRSRDIGTFSDTFSLGIVLYRCVTGDMPFHASSRFQSLVKVETSDYLAPRRIRRELSGDLESVIIKSLSSAPKDRYRDGGDFAEDLHRMRRGEPVGARPYTWRDAIRQTMRTHPVATINGLFVLAAVVLFVAMLWRTGNERGKVIDALADANVGLKAEKLRAERNEQEAIRQRQRFESLAYASDMRLAQDAFRKGDINLFDQLLDRHQPEAGETDHRTFSWYWLKNQTDADSVLIDQFPGAAYFVTFSPDGSMLAACGSDGSVRIYSTTDWSPIGRIETGQREVNCVDFSPDGKKIASAGDNGTVKVWDVQSREMAWSSRSHDGAVYQVLFTPDGNRLVSCGNETNIRIWDPQTGDPLMTLPFENSGSWGAESIDCTADGKYLVAGDISRRVWDLESGESLGAKREIPRHRISDARFLNASPEPYFVTGSMSGRLGGDRSRVLLERAGSSFEKTLFTLPASVQTIAVTDSGRTVAVGDRGGNITIADLTNILSPTADKAAVASITKTWTAHVGRVYAATFGPVDGRLITCGIDGHVRAWHASNRSPAMTAGLDDLPAPPIGDTWVAACESADANVVFAFTREEAFRWDLKQEQIESLEMATTVPASPVSSRDGSWIIGPSFSTGEVFRLDVTEGALKPRWTHKTLNSPSTTKNLFATLSPDEKWVFVCASRHEVPLVVLDSATGEPLGEFVPSDWWLNDIAVAAVAVHPSDGGVASSGRFACDFGRDLVVVDWEFDASTGVPVRFYNEQVFTVPGVGITAATFFDPDTILLGLESNQLVRLDLRPGGQATVFSGPSQPIKFLYVPDQTGEVWAMSLDGKFLTWSLAASQHLIELDVPEFGLNGHAFHLGRAILGRAESGKLFWKPTTVEMRRSPTSKPRTRYF
jgi:serine/threonine protein kinase